MKDLQRTLTVASGASVTIEAWGFGYVLANSTDFFSILEFFTHVLRGEADVLNGFGAAHGQLLTRVIEQSLARPEDKAFLKLSDIPDLMEAIFELNGLESLVKKSLLLRERQLTAATQTIGPSQTPLQSLLSS